MFGVVFPFSRKIYFKFLGGKCVLKEAHIFSLKCLVLILYCTKIILLVNQGLKFSVKCYYCAVTFQNSEAWNSCNSTKK